MELSFFYPVAQYNLSCSPTGTHCLFWNRDSLALIKLGESDTKSYSWSNISSICWSPNAKNIFVAKGRKILYVDSSDSTKTGEIAHEAPDTIIDIVVNQDEKMIVGLTRSNECVLWRLADEQQSDHLFVNSIQAVKSMYASWKA